MDNFFLSHDLFNDLTKKKINCCGTVIPNRKECHRALLTVCFLLVSPLPFPSTLRMEVIHSSEASLDFYHGITWYYIPHPHSLCYLLVSCLAYPSVLKMERVCSCKMSLNLYQTSWHYTPEDSTLHRLCLPLSCRWLSSWPTF